MILLQASICWSAGVVSLVQSGPSCARDCACSRGDTEPQQHAGGETQQSEPQTHHCPRRDGEWRPSRLVARAWGLVRWMRRLLHGLQLARGNFGGNRAIGRGFGCFRQRSAVSPPGQSVVLRGDGGAVAAYLASA